MVVIEFITEFFGNYILSNKYSFFKVQKYIGCRRAIDARTAPQAIRALACGEPPTARL